MKKRRILFVGNTSWSMYNFRLGVLQGLTKKGYEVCVAAPVDQATECLRQAGIDFIPINIDNKGTSPYRDIKLCLRLIMLYRELNPDFIIHYTIKPNIYGSLAAKFLRIPSLAFVTGAGYAFINKTWVSRVVLRLFKVAFRYPKRIWFLNTDDIELFSQSKLVEQTRVDLLPGEGINSALFNASHQIKDSSNFVFLLMGRMLGDKGVREFVEAARLIKGNYPNVEFQLLGFLDVLNPTGIKTEEITSWVDEGIVSYLGTSNSVKEVILLANCVVLPSYREGIPRTLLEAASLEIPMIATNVTGCKDVVDDGINGFLCNVKDPGDLAAKMEMMLNLSPEQRQQMGKNGRKKVLRQFDEKIIIGKYLQMLSEELAE